MSAERYIKAIIYSAAIVFTAILWLNHEDIRSQWLQYLSTAISIVLIAVVAFDLWLWKLPFLHGWFIKRPVIDGTWKVEIRSNYIDPSAKVAIPPLLGFMVVRQTFSSLSLRLLTAESSSELLGTEMVCSADGLYCVSGVYRNEPHFEVRNRSPIHYGGLWLKIIDNEKPPKVIGHYWTDRNTAGALDLTELKKKKFQTFAAACAHFQM